MASSSSSATTDFPWRPKRWLTGPRGSSWWLLWMGPCSSWCLLIFSPSGDGKAGGELKRFSGLAVLSGPEQNDRIGEFLVWLMLHLLSAISKPACCSCTVDGTELTKKKLSGYYCSSSINWGENNFQEQNLGLLTHTHTKPHDPCSQKPLPIAIGARVPDVAVSPAVILVFSWFNNAAFSFLPTAAGSCSWLFHWNELCPQAVLAWGC